MSKVFKLITRFKCVFLIYLININRKNVNNKKIKSTYEKQIVVKRSWNNNCNTIVQIFTLNMVKNLYHSYTLKFIGGGFPNFLRFYKIWNFFFLHFNVKIFHKSHTHLRGWATAVFIDKYDVPNRKARQNCRNLRLTSQFWNRVFNY